MRPLRCKGRFEEGNDVVQENQVRLAGLAADAYRESIDPTQTSVSRQRARERFLGMAAAAVALRVTPTEWAFEAAVVGGIRDAGERPAWRPVVNPAREEYDQRLAEAIAARF